MTERDEAKPRQRRNRRTIYPKRFVLRTTEEQYELVTNSAAAASATTGREVTHSEIVREAIDDGCARLAREMQRARPTEGGVTREQVIALGEAVEKAGGQIRRLGVNVDQIAAKANATGVVVDSLADVKEELRLIRAEMVAEFGRVMGYGETEDG